MESERESVAEREIEIIEESVFVCTWESYRGWERDSYRKLWRANTGMNMFKPLYQ